MLERRTGGELRAEGRRLAGTVMRYGDVSPSHRERFEPGSLRMAEAVPLNLFHDPERAVAWQPGGGLEVREEGGALAMTAELPPIPAADRALAEIRAQTATGLSVEFRAIRERREGRLRVVEEALLTGIGIVRSPSYGNSRVETRARYGGLKARIPTNRRLKCECHKAGLGGSCSDIRFARRAFAGAETDDGLMLFAKDYSRPLSSTRKGTLRVRETNDGFEIDADLPDTTGGRDLIGASENVPLIVRPVINPDASVFEEAGGVATYSSASVRALLVGATDNDEGWPEAQISGQRREAGRRLWL